MRNTLRSIFIIVTQKPYIRFIVVSGILFLLPFAVFIFSTHWRAVGFGDDASGQIFGHYYFQKHRFSWNQDDLGGASYYSYILWYAPYALFFKISQSGIFANLAVLFLFQHWFPFIAAFFFIRKIFKFALLYALVGAFFYVYNPFHLLVFYSSIYSPILSFFPFALAYFIQLINQSVQGEHKRNIFFSIAAVSISLSVAIPAISHIAYANVYFFSFSVFYFFALLRIFINRSYKAFIHLHVSLVLTLCVVLLLNFYWIYNDFLLYVSSFTGIASGSLRTFNPAGGIQFVDALRFLGDWAFRSHAFYDFYYPFYRYFFSSFGFLLTYIVSASIFFPLLVLKKNRYLIPYYIYLFFVFIFVAGTNPPGGVIFQYLYTNFNIFSIFRSPNKININLIFLYSILFAASLRIVSIHIKNSMLRYGVIVLLLFSVGFTIYPSIAAFNLNKIATNGPIRSPYQEVPQYYYELKKDIESDPLIGRILVLPYYGYGITHYWPFGSNQTAVVPKSIIDKSVLTVNTNQFGLIKEFAMGGLLLKENILRALNIRYVILLRDIDDRYKGYFNENTASALQYRPDFFEKLLSGNVIFEKVKDYFQFTESYIDTLPNDSRAPKELQEKIKDLIGKYAVSVYRISDRVFLPPIYLSNNIITDSDLYAFSERKNVGNTNPIFFSVMPNFLRTSLEHFRDFTNRQHTVQYKEVAPYKYKVRIQHIAYPTMLVLSSAFDVSWKAYPVQTRSSVAKGGYLSAVFGGSQQNDALSNDPWFTTLSRKALDPKYHLLVNNYANSWYIDFEYLKENFPDSLHRNSDGTWDVDLILEYDKQVGTYITILISGITLCCLIIFMLWYVSMKNKLTNRSLNP